jgi:hypothetical protein
MPFKVVGQAKSTPAKAKKRHDFLDSSSSSDSDSDELCSTRTGPKNQGRPVTSTANKRAPTGKHASDKKAKVETAIRREVKPSSHKQTVRNVLAGNLGANLMLSDAECHPDSAIMQLVKRNVPRLGEPVDLENVFTLAKNGVARVMAFDTEATKKTKGGKKKGGNKTGDKKKKKDDDDDDAAKSNFHLSRCSVDGVQGNKVAVHVVDEETGKTVPHLKFPGKNYSTAVASVELILVQPKK